MSATERPVIFSGRAVRAILEGRKTQTRRVVRADCQDYQRLFLDEQGILRQGGMQDQAWTKVGRWVRCPYGKPGDRLWVRETIERGPDMPCGIASTLPGIKYSADLSPVPFRDGAPFGWCGRAAWHWQREKPLPAMFMPRWASRLTLEILSVRVERLQEISENDALAEAPTFTEDADPSVSDSIGVCMFAHLWDGINGEKAPWSSNPWVWALSFKVVR